MLDTPNNLTRNILLGMFAGFVVGAFFTTQIFLAIRQPFLLKNTFLFLEVQFLLIF